MVRRKFLLSILFLCIASIFIMFFYKQLYMKSEIKEGIDAGEQLLPRSVIFGNPEKVDLSLSNDGKYLSYLAPFQGALNVYVAPTSAPDKEKVITNEKNRVLGYLWAANNKQIIYTLDKDGDENYGLYVVDVMTAELQHSIVDSNVRYSIVACSELFPDKIVISSNKRRKDLFDLYELDLRNGNITLLKENNKYASLTVDRFFKVRFGSYQKEDGSLVIDSFHYSNTGEESTKEFMTISPEDLNTTNILSFNKEADKIYLLDSIGRDKPALYMYDLDTGKKELLFESDQAEITGLEVNPVTKAIEAVRTCYAMPNWHSMDKGFAEDLKYLSSVSDGEIVIIDRSIDNKIWTVAYTKDNAPISYYIYDQENKKASYLFVNNGELQKYKLAKMLPIEIKTRDDLTLLSYLTLPQSVGYTFDRDQETQIISNIKLENGVLLPMVVLVHGGPTVRDDWGLNAIHQWLANRGYAVMSINYRGSTGFGKSFVNAGNGEWGGKMHTDLLDAVQWAIDKEIADPNKIAIMGGSYGGYAALIGMTFTPDVFACGVDIVGPSNLETLLLTIPEYWKPMIVELQRRVGADHTTEEGKRFLASRSPIHFVDKIKKPLIILHGANDPRVKRSESDQIVKSMKDNGIKVIYTMYDNEGHGFRQPQNRISAFADIEVFLSKSLGGRCEALGDVHKGSSRHVLEGGEYLHAD